MGESLVEVFSWRMEEQQTSSYPKMVKTIILGLPKALH
jgi:hypothetical protein